MKNQTNVAQSNSQDIPNSIITAGFYFRNQLINYETRKPMTTVRNGQLVPKKYQKYYFKFIDDVRYLGLDTELLGLVRTVKKNFDNRNILDKVLIYENLNGGDRAKCDNQLVCTLLFTGMKFTYQFDPNHGIDAFSLKRFEDCFNYLANELR